VDGRSFGATQDSWSLSLKHDSLEEKPDACYISSRVQVRVAAFYARLSTRRPRNHLCAGTHHRRPLGSQPPSGPFRLLG
jgi:hypothetical protein